MSESEVKTLMGSLRESEYKQGQWVFRQGEEGDAFYIITSGTAEVLRAEDASQLRHPRKLADLQAWSSFGERALLKKQARFAGIRASSPVLRCLSVDRGGFERVLGPPEKLLPDLHK